MDRRARRRSPLMLVSAGAISISGTLVALGTKLRREELDARQAARLTASAGR